MDANPRSVADLFNSQLRYVVPMFQRVYVWKEDPQWLILWEDVAEKADLELAGGKANAHYLGALIIEGVRPTSPREVKRFLVIDGQQRLTTLQLLICAFRDVARTSEWRNMERTTTRYLENVDPDVMEKPEEEQWKLWPTTLNRGVFKGVITAGSPGEVEKRFPLFRIGRRRKPEPQNPLVEAYQFFYKKITAWIEQASTSSGKTAEDCAFALLQGLQQDFSVVEIVLSEGDDSQEIFYSLNSQGRALSQSDLLRSLIFMRAEKEKINRDELFAEHWSPFETPFWSTEVKRGGRSSSRLDLGLRYFLMAKTGELVDARRVNEEYRRWITAQPPRYSSVKDELTDFRRHAEAYRRYEEPSATALPSTDLRRILIDFDVSTALPLVIHLELDAGLNVCEVEGALKLLESFIARRLILGEENKEYNKYFVELVKAVKEVQPSDLNAVLAKKLLAGSGTTRRWPTDEELIEQTIENSVGTDLRAPALRVVLERLEIASRGKKTEDLNVAPGLQIEHVMPQKWYKYWLLKDRDIPEIVADAPYLAKEESSELIEAIRLRNRRVHTLGNLTLLNGYLNPAASNGPYDLKLVEYKHSVLRLNRYFDTLKNWNEDEIAKRGRSLAELLCKIWPRPAA